MHAMMLLRYAIPTAIMIYDVLVETARARGW